MKNPLKNPAKIFFRFFVVFLSTQVSALLFSNLRAHAADVPQSFTLDGRLFSNPQGTTPLADSTIGVRLQVLDDDKLCVLYEEQQTISTAASEGYFTVQVGSQVGSTKRTVLGDSGNNMTEVFSNMAPISGKAVADGLPCIVAPIGGKRRFVRIIIAPSSLGGAERTLSPDLTIDSVPNALIAERAESIQGLRSSNLLQVNTAAGSVLTQSNLESLFANTTRFNAVTSLVDGTSSTYMRSNSTTGAQLPVLPGAPMTPPAQGSIWFDSSDEKLKFQSSGGPVTLTTGSAAISALTGDVTASGNGSVAATVAFVGGSTAANVNAATVLANSSTAANTVSTIVRRDGSGGFAAGQISASSVRFRDATTNYVELKSPAAATSYSITLPGAVGGQGQTLVTTDAAGTLGWTTAAVSSQWTTNGANIYFNTGNVGLGTTSPSSKLTVAASSGLGMAGTDAAGLRLENAFPADSTTSEYSPPLIWTGQAANPISENSREVSFRTFVATENSVDGGTGSLLFQSKFGTSAYQDVLALNINGNVGIGTNAPTGILDVRGGPGSAGASGRGINLQAEESPDTVGGSVSINAGRGWTGGNVSISAGPAVVTNGTPGNTFIGGGAGHNSTGGNLELSGGSSVNGTGGNVYVLGGDGNSTFEGSVILGTSAGGAVRGNVGVGVLDPSTKLDLGGALTQRAMSAPAVSAAGQGRIFFDSATGKFRVSQNGGAYSDLVQPLGATAAGNAGKIAKFTGASTLADSLISDDGNEVTVAANLVSTPSTLPTGSTINLRTSNTHILSDIGGSTITLQNPAHGGLYNIVVADMAVRTYTFNGCTNSFYKPARGPTVNNTQTVFGILFVDAGAGTWNCYITWSTGFAAP